MTLETQILLAGFPFLAPLIATALFWKKLDRKWLFLLTSFLSMTALADLGFSVFSAWLVPAPSPLPADLLGFSIQSARLTHISLLLTDGVVLIIGLPLLAWLFAAMRRVPRMVTAGETAVM